jgi:transposase-like protein
MISEEMEQKYVKLLGNNCPFCNSHNIIAMEQMQTDGGDAWQDIKCEDCGEWWTDLYKLVGAEQD